MRIDIFFDEFISSKSLRYDTDLRKTAKALLKGSKPYSLTKMPEFGESEYLAENIKSSVKAAPRGKDSAIRAYKAFVSFLFQKGVEVEVTFPPIPIENSFERQMYIAKYLQDEKVRYKKYFYALRPLLAARYIENRHGEPPVLFEQLEGELPAELRETVGRLLEIKRQTAESEKLPAIAPISAFIEKELEFQREMLAKLPDDRNPDYSGLNGILRGTVLGTQADVSR